MSLWQMSFYGGVTILVVAALRSRFWDKLPRQSFLVLWAVVVMRLLVPINVGLGCNIYTWIEAGISAWADSKQGFPAPGGSMVSGIFGGSTGSPANGALVSAGEEEAAESPGGQGGGIRDGLYQAAVFLAPIGKFAYWAGVFSCVGFYLSVYARCRREFQYSLPVGDPFVLKWADSVPLRRRVTVRQSEAVSAPVTYGVFHPVILLPKKGVWEDASQLEFALAHEAEHIRHFDACKKLALVAAACVHWFNPLVWRMLVLANRDLEVACDARVVRRYGPRFKSAYAYALISMEEKKSNWAILGNGFSENGLEERIVAIMKIKKRTIGAFMTAAVMVAGVTTVFATAPASRPGAGHGSNNAAEGEIDVVAVEEGRAPSGEGKQDSMITVGVIQEGDSENGYETIVGVLDNGTIGSQEHSAEAGGSQEYAVENDAIEVEGSNGTAEEIGEGDGVDVPEEYTSLGIQKAGASEGLQWNGKTVAVLYDEGRFTYTSDTRGKDAVYLLAERGPEGNITALKELGREEMGQILGELGLVI